MGPQVTAAILIFILLQKSSSPLQSDRSSPLLSIDINGQIDAWSGFGKIARQTISYSLRKWFKSYFPQGHLCWKSFNKQISYYIQIKTLKQNITMVLCCLFLINFYRVFFMLLKYEVFRCHFETPRWCPKKQVNYLQNDFMDFFGILEGD